MGSPLRRRLRLWMAWPLASLLLLLIAFGALLSLFDSLIIALLPVITSARPGTVLDFAPLRAVGLLSYSPYLWQQPILMARTYSIFEISAHIAALFCYAAFSWWFLEPHPRRSIRNKQFPPLQSSDHLSCEIVT